MKTKKVKEKKCAWCKKPFSPRYKTTEKVCSVSCGIDWAKNDIKKKREKAEREERKVLKKGLLTHSDWLKIFQRVFNTYIRYRDQHLTCVSCGKHVEGTKGDASHYWPVKPYYGLRFNEDNVHRSCDECNTHLHGNLAEYQIRLVLKIGLDRFKHLEKIRHCELRLTIPEIQEQIKIYKQKIKDLKNG